jgi:predicted nucleic acid-binding protein
MLPVLPVTLEVARFHSRLWAGLQQRGEIIAPHDLLIAATALAHNLTLITDNHRHFGRIEGLKISTW